MKLGLPESNSEESAGISLLPKDVVAPLGDKRLLHSGFEFEDAKQVFISF